jgi:predicted hydrocarbon binding protein
MVFIYKDGRDLVGYEAVLPNVPGAIRYIASITEKYGLNIVYIEECTVSEGNDLFFIVVDFTDKDVDPEMLLKEFRRNKKYVTSVEMSPSFKNVIFPRYFCVKTLGGLRVILMGFANMKGLLNGLKKQLGEEASSSFIYHLGYGVGRELYDIYSKYTPIEGPEEGVKLLEALTKGASWCELISYSIKGDKIILKLGKLWECEMLRGMADKPTSNYVRGMLVSFFEKVLDKPGGLVAIEKKCIGQGEPYCEFEIKII